MNEGGSARAELRQSGMSDFDIQQIRWISERPGTATAGASPDGDLLTGAVSGIATGEAVIRAEAPGVGACKFYVTVLPEGENTGVIRASYLTTTKNALYFANAEESADLSVTGPTGLFGNFSFRTTSFLNRSFAGRRPQNYKTCAETKRVSAQVQYIGLRYVADGLAVWG